MLFEPFFAAMQISLTIPNRTQRTSRQMACPMDKLETSHLELGAGDHGSHACVGMKAHTLSAKPLIASG
jgi:hypothetical protein